MRKLFSVLGAVGCVLLLSCNDSTNNKAGKKDIADSANGEDKTAIIDGHPSWIEQGNIYEVNVRQYTPEGTFKAFEPALQRLKNMGVQTLWFMPINPISVKDRKGPLGSYYAVSDYTAINPEYGNLEDWKSLVARAHDMGFRVIIDWVPNHTGADHRWLTTNPDFYVRDSATGQPLSPFDWTDTRKLNYKNVALQDSMITSMKYWLTTSDIDGFRCDVAGEVPDDFWNRCLTELKKTRPGLFFLAETDKPEIHKDGFDASYGWSLMQMMYKIAAGKRPAFGIDSVLNNIDSTYPANAMKMYFTSNHDENSWNKADFGTYPGASHAPFAVLSQTISRSVPLIYSGQEEPFLDSVRFFYKDTITFGTYARADFYKTLLALRKNNKALAANASFKKLHTTSDVALYAFEREKDGDKVLVIVNLSKKPQRLTWKDQPSAKEWNNVFLMNKEPVDKGFAIGPWGYVVYELKS